MEYVYEHVDGCMYACMYMFPLLIFSKWGTHLFALGYAGVVMFPLLRPFPSSYARFAWFMVVCLQYYKYLEKTA